MSRTFSPLPAALVIADGVPAARIAFHAQADASILDQIRFGVLFVMAWWSGPAIAAYGKLSRRLAALDPEGRLELVVVDTDGLPAQETAEFLGRMHGAGETTWVRDGRVVATSLWRGSVWFESLTRDFLAERDDRLVPRAGPRYAQ